jgi:8-oxo-dGTP diphosphatase
MWEFPGGKVDPGESPQQALVRELREELGIEVGVGAALEPVCWEDESGMIRLWPFVCTMLGGEMTVMSHERVAWVGLEELEEFDWAPADVPVLGQTRAFFARDLH